VFFTWAIYRSKAIKNNLREYLAIDSYFSLDEIASLLSNFKADHSFLDESTHTWMNK
jgi:hypothetical protein